MPQPTALPFKTRDVPAHLDGEEAKLFASVARSYALNDEVSLKILEEGCASLMRARLARERLAEEGMTVRDAKKQIKPHPLCAVERDARAAGLSAFKQLNLELPRVSKGSAW